MPDNSPVLTRDEIQLLLTEGEISPFKLSQMKLTPVEKREMWDLVLKNPDIANKHGVPVMGPPAGGGMELLKGAGNAISGLASSASGMAADAAPAIGAGLGAAVKHPWLGYRAGQAAQKWLRRGNAPAKAVANSTASLPKGQQTLPLEDGTPTVPRPLDANYKGPQTHGPERPPAPQPKQSSFNFADNLEREIGIDDLLEQQQRGVQNNFAGGGRPVSLRPLDKSPDPPNLKRGGPGKPVNLERNVSPEDLEDLVTGKSGKDWADHRSSRLEDHVPEAEVERVRREIAAMLDQKRAQRRRPK